MLSSARAVAMPKDADPAHPADDVRLFGHLDYVEFAFRSISGMTERGDGPILRLQDAPGQARMFVEGPVQPTQWTACVVKPEVPPGQIAIVAGCDTLLPDGRQVGAVVRGTVLRLTILHSSSRSEYEGTARIDEGHLILLVTHRIQNNRSAPCPAPLPDAVLAQLAQELAGPLGLTPPPAPRPQVRGTSGYGWLLLPREGDHQQPPQVHATEILCPQEVDGKRGWVVLTHDRRPPALREPEAWAAPRPWNPVSRLEIWPDPAVLCARRLGIEDGHEDWLYAVVE